MSFNMSALDIKISTDEIRQRVTGAWVNKIYEIDGVYLFKLNPKEDNEDRNLVIEPGERIHLSSKEYSTPRKPPSFAMLLRKHLSNKRLVEVFQPDFERVIRLTFEEAGETRRVYCELFGDGNIILCKENDEIIQPYYRQNWQGRTIEPDEQYSLPPKKGNDPTDLSKEELEKIISESPDLVRGLARNLAIGGNLAEEICSRAEVDGGLNYDSLGESDIENVYEAVRDLLTRDTSARVNYEGGEISEPLPFNFETKSCEEVENFDSFNEALDHFYHKKSEGEADEERREEKQKEISEIENRLRQQEDNISKLEKKAEEAKNKADIISNNHGKIGKLIDTVNDIRENEGWDKVKSIAENPEDYPHKLGSFLSSVKPNHGKIILSSDGKEIDLDVRKSSFENASIFYEESKKMKRKKEGAKEALSETEQELQKLKEEPSTNDSEKISRKSREKKWFEKFRWFYSSQDLLVIAGRDRETNKEIVENHMEKGDRYFHADLKGAPHVVVKIKDEEISDNTNKEAAIFAAIHSRAWKKNLGNADVYWVNSDQVTEDAPSGEYLPKGGYMIEGERNYMTVPIEAAVGVVEEEGNAIPVVGPGSAVDSTSDLVLKIKPGDTKKSDLAKKIKSRMEEELDIRLDLDELIRKLPPGPGMLLD